VPTVGVIIPYFQREQGLLRRSLESVVVQSLPPDVRLKIVVVDDASPAPVDEEAAGLMLPSGCDLTIISQSNAGPGAARNAGLDAMDPKEISFVAFLDSDDTWHPDHLAEALEQLRSSNFYFANAWEDETDFFSYSKYIRRKHRRARHGDYDPVVRQISAAEALEALLEACFIHTSQVVYDFRKNRQLRFVVDQGRAGEDYLFWLDLSTHCERVAYSTKPMGRRGWGVSLYRESLSWDSEHALDSLIDGLKLQKKIRQYAIDPAAGWMLRQKRQRMTDRLMLLMLRDLRRRPHIVWGAIKRVAKELPEFFLHAPASLVRLPAHIRMTRAKAVNDQVDQQIAA
jgi:succinoglycan biosynthesis protein ExoW